MDGISTMPRTITRAACCRVRATFSRRGKGVDEQTTRGEETGRIVRGTEQGVEQWPITAADVFTGLADWRAAHPRATLQEIEQTLDERLALLRARMREDLALASRQADVQALPVEERPVCPACGGRVEARGAKTRRLTTTYERQITLTRSYAVCPACGTGLFPPG